MAIKNNDNISVDYEGRLENGEIFDSSKHGDHSHPLEFQVGSGMVIKGFDDTVLGMNKGDEKEFTILSKDAYGDHNPKLLQKVPRNVLPKEQVPEKGMYLMVQTPDGKGMPVLISDVDNEFITIDMNHPLAGKNLIFKIKIVEVKSSK